MASIQHPFTACCETIDTSKNDMGIVRPANRDWACQTERCRTLSNKTNMFPGFKWPPFFLFLNSFKLNLEERHLACAFKCTPHN